VTRRVRIDAAAFVRSARSAGKRAERDNALYWRDYKLKHGPAAGIRIADELRRQVVAKHPDWPDESELADSRATHQRISDALASVATRRR
jgi:hypothetical protein